MIRRHLAVSKFPHQIESFARKNQTPRAWSVDTYKDRAAVCRSINRDERHTSRNQSLRN